MQEDGAKVDRSAKGSDLGRNVLNAVLVAVLGFVLLNLTFMIYALFYNGISRLFGGPPGEGIGAPEGRMPPQYLRLLLLSLILVASYFIHRSKLHEVLKAAFLTVPVAASLVTVGIYFYETPVLIYVVGAVICAGFLYALFRNKEGWLSYFSVLLVAASLVIMGLLGIDI